LWTYWEGGKTGGKGRNRLRKERYPIGGVQLWRNGTSRKLRRRKKADVRAESNQGITGAYNEKIIITKMKNIPRRKGGSTKKDMVGNWVGRFLFACKLQIDKKWARKFRQNRQAQKSLTGHDPDKSKVIQVRTKKRGGPHQIEKEKPEGNAKGSTLCERVTRHETACCTPKVFDGANSN